MSPVALISVGTILSVMAAVTTFTHGLLHKLTLSMKATLEVVSGLLWILGSVAILISLVRVRGIEIFDLFFDVLLLCGIVSLILGIIHKSQIANAKSIKILESEVRSTSSRDQIEDSTH